MNNIFSDTRIKNLTIVVIALLGLFLLIQSVSAFVGIKQKRNMMPSNVITVRGTGEAIGTPDIATFSFTVRESNKDATAAQQAMTEKSNKAIEYLKGQGIAEKDIKVESYYANPSYSYGGCTSGYCVPSKPTLTGYEVSQTTSVKVREIGKAGDLLTGIANLKIGEVSSLSFTIDDLDTLKAEAKKQAIEKARVEAEQIAESLGIDLDRVVGYYDESPYDRPMEGYEGNMSIKVQDASGMSPILPTGEQKVTATVSVTYEVEN